MIRKSTCWEGKDRVKHKPVKQKVPVKKGKTEKSKGYDEKKVPVRKCKTSVEMKIKCLFKRKSTCQEVKDKRRNENQMPLIEKKYLLGSARQAQK